MHRLIATCLLSGMILSLAGCAGRKQYKEEKEGWSQSQWKQALREDQERIKSEDERKSDAMLPGMRKATGAFWEQVTRIYNYMTGATPFEAAKAMLEPKYPDKRRQGIMWLSARQYGREDPYLKYYGSLARTDPQHTVRAMAVRAMNRARVKDATTIYLAALEDKNELVRLEAAKALANIPEPLAMQALMKRLDSADESVDVRVACADALRTYRNAEVAQVLIRTLRDRQFGVSWQARKSLKLMTGKDYRYNQAAWLTYLSGAEKPFG